MVKLAIWDAPIADQASDQNAERLAVLDAAGTYVDLSSLLAELTRRVTYESESQEPSRQAELKRDLTEEIEGVLGEMGFVSSHIDNPVDPGLPMLIARRQEDGALPTVLVYGHGDVVRGDASRWREGLSPAAIEGGGRSLVRSRHG